MSLRTSPDARQEKSMSWPDVFVLVAFFTLLAFIVWVIEN